MSGVLKEVSVNIACVCSLSALDHRSQRHGTTLNIDQPYVKAFRWKARPGTLDASIVKESAMAGDVSFMILLNAYHGY